MTSAAAITTQQLLTDQIAAYLKEADEAKKALDFELAFLLVDQADTLQVLLDRM
jgi:hypothetical protein